MAIYKKINGQDTKIAENSIVDHSQLTGRSSMNAHPISAIRKLPEKLTELKNKSIENSEAIEAQAKAIKDNTDAIAKNTQDIDSVATHASGIKLESDLSSGEFIFTDYNGDQTTIQGGYLPDNTTIVLTQDNKLQAKGLQTNKGYLSGNVIEEIISAQGGYLDSYNFGTATPTQEDLVDYAIQNIGDTVYGYLGQIDEETFNSHTYLYTYDESTDTYTQATTYNAETYYYFLNIWDKTRVINLFDHHTWIWDLNSEYWSDLGETQIISDANNDGLHGLVTGSYEDYEGYIDVNGQIKVNALPELANTVAGKQDALTAGSNIEINQDNIISAKNATRNISGTTYTWVDEDGYHSWTVNPDEVNYTEEDGIYIITTLNYTENDRIYILGENE